jgi:hypothetical protein
MRHYHFVFEEKPHFIFLRFDPGGIGAAYLCRKETPLSKKREELDSVNLLLNNWQAILTEPSNQNTLTFFLWEERMRKMAEKLNINGPEEIMDVIEQIKKEIQMLIQENREKK